jgi:periplasmic divalent cation tolerance protein
LPGAAILVLTQMPDLASAQALARALVEARLAACVSIGAPVESLYHWRGEIETAAEVPLVVKTGSR